MNHEIDVPVTRASRLELFPLRVNPDADRFIVGRPAVGAYVALSGGALAATDLLRDGHTVADTAEILSREHGGEVIRLRPLLETLLAAGLVKAVDGAPLPEALPPRRYHLTFLQRRHVAWAFSRPAAAMYGCLIGAALGIVLAEPRYLPRPSAVFVTTAPGKNVALLWAVSLIALAAHELAHVMAATFLGIRASFALGNRFFFAVAQTDLTDLWLVDRDQRYLAYAAGMVNDLVLASAALIALWLADQQMLPLPELPYRVLRLAVLLLAFGVLWQFNFYLRTDVYYLVANLTGCRNLWRDAASWLKAAFSRSDPLAGVPEPERRVVRAFAVLMVLGTTAAVAAGALYLGAILLLLTGRGPFRDRGLLLPILASLGVTACWLACAKVAGRRRRPGVHYRVIGPEDL